MRLKSNTFIASGTALRIFVFVLTVSFLSSCHFVGASSTRIKEQEPNESSEPNEAPEPRPAAYSTDDYLKLLKGKRIGVVANQTSVIMKASKSGYTHLVDSLLSLGIEIDRVFAPEHGFRGLLDAGEHVKDQKDPKTNLPIISLYGANKKPSQDQLSQIDLILFDIQDVGARFYTYISTLHYIMEACAESGIPLIVLDRPNPNGHYIDGPVLDPKYKSFVGMHPVPVVYGMTIGEYAQMINGEKWLDQGLSCDLTVVLLKDYDHSKPYHLPVKPSPNLPNGKAINLYPSLCFFEGTAISCGRGTEMQFQIFGSPELPASLFEFSFTPEPNFGSKHPKFQGEICYGRDLRQEEELDQLNLSWIIEAYENYEDQASFFNDFFVKLAGTTSLRQSIEQGLSDQEIREQWTEGLDRFKSMRSKYLIYE